LDYRHDPFILAKHAKQVFYVVDPTDKRWHVVLQGKRRIVGVGNVVDKEKYDHFDEIPPFFTGIEAVPMLVIDHEEINYLCSDHEGVWVQRKKSKE
jgi:Domain of unknown function (DUF4216)